MRLTYFAGCAVLMVICNFLLLASPAKAQTAPGSQQEQATPNNTPSHSGSSDQASDFSEQIIREVLGKLHDGMQAHNLEEILSVFDPQITPNFPELRDQMRAFLTQYDGIEFRYKLLQVSSEKENGYATCDIDLDAVATDDSQMPIRRSVQMRFQLRRGAKEWKVVGFKPADFFS